MTRAGVAVIALAALLGAAAGTGAAILGRDAGRAAAPTETTAEEAPEPTVQESGFWTAVIASIEARRSDAQELADEVVADAAAKGQEAFVLDGTAYTGLGDAYLAVCVGRFDDEAGAKEQVAQLQGLGYDSPYTRDVGELSTDGQDGNQGEGGDGGGDD
jgi:hypothetical protein